MVNAIRLLTHFTKEWHILEQPIGADDKKNAAFHGRSRTAPSDRARFGFKLKL